MPNAVEIGIFMIGRTVVDRAEIRRWLDFIGADEFEVPEDGAVSNPSLLIALAGKRCYKSFQPGLNPNVTKIRADYVEYFDNILKSGHGSVLEHSVYNFAIENVSRVFTGEMNRHRAGWAISEGSMRFIRYSDSIPYWVPDSIKADKEGVSDLATAGCAGAADSLIDAAHSQATLAAERARLFDIVKMQASYDLLAVKKEITRDIFTKAFAHTEQCYRVMESIWAEELAPESKFKGKKEITSMMRRIVGMGVATGGVWSGNIRALRHVLTMRAAPAAEEEMLHVFSRVAKMMRDTEPNLFGDFEIRDGYWAPKYVKV